MEYDSSLYFPRHIAQRLEKSAVVPGTEYVAERAGTSLSSTAVNAQKHPERRQQESRHCHDQTPVRWLGDNAC